MNSVTLAVFETKYRSCDKYKNKLKNEKTKLDEV